MKIIECSCPLHGTFYISLPGWSRDTPEMHCPQCTEKCKIVRIDPNGD
jgi:hypothetical protein